MVSTMIIALAIVGILGFLLLSRTGVASGKTNDIGTLSDFLKQQELDVSPTRTQIGAVGLGEGKTDANSSPEQTKLNVITSNLFTEEALRNVIKDTLNVSQVNTKTTSGTETRSVKGLEIFKDPNSRIVIEDAFNSIGKEIVINPNTVNSQKGARNFAQNFVGRKDDFFQVTTVRSDGSLKTRFGSEALINRLQDNAIRNQK